MRTKLVVYPQRREDGAWGHYELINLPPGIQLHIGTGAGGEHRVAGYVNMDILHDADVRGDMRAIPFADSSFSLVMLIHTLEHVDFRGVVRTIKEFHRVLKPGGCVVCGVPDLYETTRFYREADNIADRLQRMSVIYGAHTDKFDVHHIGFDKMIMEWLWPEWGFAVEDCVSEHVSRPSPTLWTIARKPYAS